MNYECCVEGCRSLKGVVPMHKFPRNIKQFQRWKTAVYSKKIEGLTDDQLRKENVCYRHFKEEDYLTYTQRRTLKTGAIPLVVIESTTEEMVAVPEVREDIENQERENPQPSCSYHVEGRRAISPSVKTPQMSLLDKKMQRTALTPRKVKLYKTAQLLRSRQAHSQKTLHTIKEKVAEGRKWLASQAFQSQLSKLTPTQQTFIKMQLKTSKHAPKGRPYSLDEKIFCLSLYKQSPKCYHILAQLLNMPSARVLRRLMNRISLKAGINASIVSHLAEKGKSMRPSDKICYLTWDEVSITPHVDYCTSSNQFVGFVDHGETPRPQIADVALVFMLRGIRTGWKLPLAFYFSQGQTNYQTLIALIIKITGTIMETGMRIVAFVCDQASSNVKAINELLSQSAPSGSNINGRPNATITLNGENIIVIYDPPHLIKGIRNNLLTKDLEIVNRKTNEKEYLSWKTIQLGYKMSFLDFPVKFLDKITEEHINMQKIKKMSVKHATQVLSSSMAKFILNQACTSGSLETMYGPMDMPRAEGIAAAVAIQFFNELFDSLNGHTVKPESTYRVAVTRNSPHRQFWKSALRQLEQMRFVDPVTRQSSYRSLCLESWVKTIQGFERLTALLQAEGFKYFFPRHVNQDALENLFGAINSLEYGNIKPTAIQFISAFKTLFVSNMVMRDSKRYNCETIGTGDLLFNLKYLLETPPESEASNCTEGILFFQPASLLISDINQNFCVLIKKSIEKRDFIQCTICETFVQSNNFLQICSQAHNIIHEYVDLYGFMPELKVILRTALCMYLDLDINCNSHSQDMRNQIMEITMDTYLDNWSRRINRFLMGKGNPGAATTSIEKEALQKSMMWRNKRRKRPT